jgi:hypothetical protein
VDNPETQATLDRRHRTKDTTQKTRKIKNTTPTKKTELNLMHNFMVVKISPIITWRSVCEH